VRNEKACVCSVPVSVVRLIVVTRSISGKIIKEMPGSVMSGTHYRNRNIEIQCGIFQEDSLSPLLKLN